MPDWELPVQSYADYEQDQKVRLNGQQKAMERANAITELALGTQSASDLDGVDPGPVRWIVPGLIPPGYSILTGAPKAGKTFLATDISLGVAAGGRVLSSITVAARPVLYVAMEDDQNSLHRRLQIVWGKGHYPTNWRFITGEKLAALQGNVMDFILETKRMFGTQLVILDTMATVARPDYGRGGNVKNVEYSFGTEWLQFCTRYDISVLGLWHDTKGAGRAKDMNAIDAMSGTAGAAAAPNAILWLHADARRGMNAGILEGHSRAGENFKVSLRRTGGCWVAEEGMPVGEEVHVNTSPRTIEVIRRARAAGRITIGDLRDLFDNPNTASQACHRLVSSGHLVRLGKGEFGAVVDHSSAQLYMLPTPLTSSYDGHDGGDGGDDADGDD